MGDLPYVNAPEFLDRVESDDFLEQIIPVVALGCGQPDEPVEKRGANHTLPVGGLVNQRVHLF